MTDQLLIDLYFARDKRAVGTVSGPDLNGNEVEAEITIQALTLDDGYEDNYTNLFPLLKKYQAKATISVVTGSIGQPGILTADQIREMSDSGLVEFASHTVTHPHLTSLDDLPEMPDLGGEGQMRISENGEIVDPAELAEITGADTPETAGPAAEETGEPELP